MTTHTEVQPTSLQAKESIRPAINYMEEKIRKHIIIACGSTCDEIECALYMRHQTVSGRIRSLVKKGILTDSGARRKTRSGRSAIVWIVSEYRDKQLYLF